MSATDSAPAATATPAANGAPAATAVTAAGAKLDPAVTAAGAGLDPAAGLRRNADFNRLWLGEGVSVIGSQVTALALPLTAVLTLNASAEQVGVLRFLQMIPFLVFALPFGVWVDRARRRPILIWTNVARLVLIGSIRSPPSWPESGPGRSRRPPPGRAAGS